jgi:hypothetical protein
MGPGDHLGSLCTRFHRGAPVIPTKERLAQRLHVIGLFDFEARARAGEFSDFESNHPLPKVHLVGLLNNFYKSTRDILRGQMALDLATEVMEGKWDDTKEEAEAWFAREGKDLKL